MLSTNRLRLTVACLALAACETDTDEATVATEATDSTRLASQQPISTEPVPEEPVPMSTSDQPAANPTSNPSPQPPTPSDAPTAPDAPRDCRRLTDFDDEPSGWFVVNDGVMGGRSEGVIGIADSSMRFSGTIVTDGGGFTSVRQKLTGGELVGSDRLEIRVRADRRVYGLILDDEHRIDGRNVSYRADLDTSGPTDPDGWQIVSLPYDVLVPTIFGRVVDSPPFVADEATEIGFIIADGLDGDFALDVDWVDACSGD